MSENALRTVSAVLSNRRSYRIMIGENALSRAGAVMTDLNPAQKKAVIVTENNVEKLYAESLKQSLTAAGVESAFLTLPLGEETKNFYYLEKVVRFCLQEKVERNHAIIALGGGVIGDLVGFAASTVRRGCRFIQIPTTLLAQTDSSVGGKTAINAPEGKNLIGAFYQPAAVLADTACLQSLPQRDYAAGFAEVIKYALLGDAEFFTFLSRNIAAFHARDPAFLTEIVTKCVQMKADIVARDETERGERALLNLGHTFGHAYEAETGYSHKLLHGEAVAIGCVNAFDYSASHGLCSKEDAVKARDLFSEAGLPVSIKAYIPDFSPDKIVAHMFQDKKTADGKLTFILARKIGEAFIQKDVSAEKIAEFLTLTYGE